MEIVELGDESGEMLGLGPGMKERETEVINLPCLCLNVGQTSFKNTLPYLPRSTVTNTSILVRTVVLVLVLALVPDC